LSYEKAGFAMHLPQVVVYEPDGRLAAQLRPLAERQAWSLREPRQAEACLRLLPAGEPGVLVVKLGRDLEDELGLVQRARQLSPATGIIVVADSDHPRLAGLAWDLGATLVLTPSPAPPEHDQNADRRATLFEVLSAWMQGTIPTAGEQAPGGADGGTATGQ
jgi:hypothetical protein